MNDLTEWKKRADSGDSRYAIALALMAIAEAISDKGTKEVGIIDHVSSSLDDKFDTLIRVMERLPEEEDSDTSPLPLLKRRWWQWHRT